MSACSNYIINNNIYSNNSYGIYLPSNTANNNLIITNNIFGLNQSYGIYITKSINNIINYNKVHQNQQYGIELKFQQIGTIWQII